MPDHRYKYRRGSQLGRKHEAPGSHLQIVKQQLGKAQAAAAAGAASPLEAGFAFEAGLALVEAGFFAGALAFEAGFALVEAGLALAVPEAGALALALEAGFFASPVTACGR